MNVLDNNHGIDTGDMGEYFPWYSRGRGESRLGYETNYYTRVGGWKRVVCKSWKAAYNHIARSRGLPTSGQPGSTYLQECAVPSNPGHAEQPDAPITYSLLVSNVGWVRNDCPDYDEVKCLFDEYAGSGQYEQVTMWSSVEHDPIEEAYLEEDDFDPWYHPQYDDCAESQPEWDC